MVSSRRAGSAQCLPGATSRDGRPLIADCRRVAARGFGSLAISPVTAWREGNPRFAERFFANLGQDVIRPGSFASVSSWSTTPAHSSEMPIQSNTNGRPRARKSSTKSDAALDKAEGS